MIIFKRLKKTSFEVFNTRLKINRLNRVSKNRKSAILFLVNSNREQNAWNVWFREGTKNEWGKM